MFEVPEELSEYEMYRLKFRLNEIGYDYDEYLEITPTSLRIRKIILDEVGRKRARNAAEESEQ